MTSLVSPKDVAYHLRLLEAIRTYVFALSRDHVKFVNGELVTTPAGNLLFRRSIHRLKLWITQVLRPKFNFDQSCKGLQDYEVPPFDVLVLLHSYMLHPHSFYEDSIRLHPEIAVLSGFPFEQVAARIDASGEYIATPEQVAFWEETTGEGFAPPLQTDEKDAFAITCPSCRHFWTALWIEVGSDGTISCNKCKLLITDDILGSAAVLHDMDGSNDIGLAGTILDRQGAVDLSLSRALTSRVKNTIDYGSIMNLPLGAVTEHLQTFSQPSSGVKVKCFELYGHTGGFSTDLPAAMLRQTKFASILYHAGWTNLRFPVEAANTITESISRYEGFLKIAAGRKYGPVSPTKEIDLVWHTHQLATNYRTDVTPIVGYFLNHVDNSPKNHLQQSSDCANDAWKNLGHHTWRTS